MARERLTHQDGGVRLAVDHMEPVERALGIGGVGRPSWREEYAAVENSAFPHRQGRQPAAVRMRDAVDWLACQQLDQLAGALVVHVGPEPRGGKQGVGATIVGMDCEASGFQRRDEFAGPAAASAVDAVKQENARHEHNDTT